MNRNSIASAQEKVILNSWACMCLPGSRNDQINDIQKYTIVRGLYLVIHRLTHIYTIHAHALWRAHKEKCFISCSKPYMMKASCCTSVTAHSLRCPYLSASLFVLLLTISKGSALRGMLMYIAMTHAVVIIRHCVSGLWRSIYITFCHNQTLFEYCRRMIYLFVLYGVLYAMHTHISHLCCRSFFQFGMNIEDVQMHQKSASFLTEQHFHFFLVTSLYFCRNLFKQYCKEYQVSLKKSTE